MSAYDQHLKKYEHNKSFCQFGISSTREDFSDWEITARFYAAVHLIEAIMSKCLNAHSRNHEMRDQTMSDHTEIFSRNCASDYATLKALARKARYETVMLSAKEALKSQECLEDMALECQAYLNQPPIA